MSKFIKPLGDTRWYQLNPKNGRMYDRGVGILSFSFDENDPSYAKSEIIEAEDWHDLFKKTGYSGLCRDITAKDLWVDREGGCWEGLAHAVAAQEIVEDIIGEDLDLAKAEGYLVDNGWVKLTTSFMLDYYINDGMYDYITTDQARTIKEWCDFHEFECWIDDFDK